MSFNRSPLLVLALAGGLLTFSPALAQATAQPTAPAKPAIPQPAAKPVEAKPEAAAEKLPTGKEVLARALEAIGTAKAREAIKNRVSTGTLKIESQGVDGKFVYKVGEKGKMINDIDLGEMVGKVIRWANGKKAAELQPGGAGARLLTGDDLLDAQRSATLFPEATPDAFFKTIETKGVEKIDGKDCYKVETTTASGEKRSWFYAKETGLIVKWSSAKKRGPMEVTTDTFLSDWKEFDGVKVATSQKQVNNFGEMSLEILIHTDKVEHNTKLTDADFAVPEELREVVSGDAKTPAKDDAKPAPASEKTDKPKHKSGGK